MGDWFDRLIAAIEADPRSKRKLSADAGLGPNYVSQMIVRRSDPGTEKLMKLLATLGPASALRVLTGMELSERDSEIFRVVSGFDEDLKDEALRFFLVLQAKTDKKPQ